MRSAGHLRVESKAKRPTPEPPVERASEALSPEKEASSEPDLGSQATAKPAALAAGGSWMGRVEGWAVRLKLSESGTRVSGSLTGARKGEGAEVCTVSGTRKSQVLILTVAGCRFSGTARGAFQSDGTVLKLAVPTPEGSRMSNLERR